MRCTVCNTPMEVSLKPETPERYAFRYECCCLSCGKSFEFSSDIHPSDLVTSLSREEEYQLAVICNLVLRSREEITYTPDEENLFAIKMRRLGYLDQDNFPTGRAFDVARGLEKK